MDKFELISSYKPTGDQPQAIEKLVDGINPAPPAPPPPGAPRPGPPPRYCMVLQVRDRHSLWQMLLKK